MITGAPTIPCFVCQTCTRGSRQTVMFLTTILIFQKRRSPDPRRRVLHVVPICGTAGRRSLGRREEAAEISDRADNSTGSSCHRYRISRTRPRCNTPDGRTLSQPSFEQGSRFGRRGGRCNRFGSRCLLQQVRISAASQDRTKALSADGHDRAALRVNNSVSFTNDVRSKSDILF